MFASPFSKSRSAAERQGCEGGTLESRPLRVLLFDSKRRTGLLNTVRAEQARAAMISMIRPIERIHPCEEPLHQGIWRLVNLRPISVVCWFAGPTLTPS